MSNLHKKINIVLDIGKTNVKLLFLRNKKVIKEYKTKQTIKYYRNIIRTLEADKVVDWLIKKINNESKYYIFENFVCTTHGCSLAFIDFDNKEILACTDYEFNFDKYKKDFLKIQPKFSSSFTPLLEGGLNTGVQLFYLYKKFPNILKKTKYILSYPQYISWKLSKTYASEITYIGCHSFLWDFKKNHYSQLVNKLSVEKKFPALKKAWDVIGQYKINNKKINILNGIHDSNASYLYFLKSNIKNFTLVSTGTWYITLNQQASVKILEPNYDMLCGINAFGKSVPTMRFMGGREYDILIKKLKISSKKFKISQSNIFDNLIFPSFASGGPFKIKNYSLRKILALSSDEKYSLICIYISFVLNFVLDRINSKNTIILDGPIIKNKHIMNIISSIRDNQKIFKNNEEIGTGLGASILFDIKKKNKLSLSKIKPTKKYSLKKIYAFWVSEVKRKNLLKM
tara:strand:+ start:2735 stop:4102 length:1368 start_codon:yes stop_codon:yes gene_type:complete